MCNLLLQECRTHYSNELHLPFRLHNLRNIHTFCHLLAIPKRNSSFSSWHDRCCHSSSHILCLHDQDRFYHVRRFLLPTCRSDDDANPSQLLHDLGDLVASSSVRLLNLMLWSILDLRHLTDCRRQEIRTWLR